MEEGVASGVFPGGVLLIAYEEKICFHQAFGFAQIVPTKIPLTTHTFFDLASLTKPLATTSLMALLIERGALSLEDPLSRFIPEYRSGDKSGVTLAHLLSHRSGLPDWRPYYEEVIRQDKKNPGFLGSSAAKEAVYQMARHEPLVAMPGTSDKYSDIGFILLAEIIEKVSGVPLDIFCHDEIFSMLKCELFFQRLGRERVGHFAATEDCPWRGEVVCGKAHDDNAYAMGGVSGHAGLFGTAQAVYTMVKCWQDSIKGEELIDTQIANPFVTRREGNFLLGWDTPSPNHSSSGRFFSPASFGHLGYTGTSIWVDPIKSLVVILLTNRVHPRRDNDRIKLFRPEIHDIIYKEVVH
jgi:CubicO group peptidase (beta-lactamase class C family)